MQYNTIQYNQIRVQANELFVIAGYNLPNAFPEWGIPNIWKHKKTFWLTYRSHIWGAILRDNKDVVIVVLKKKPGTCCSCFFQHIHALLPYLLLQEMLLKDP